MIVRDLKVMLDRDLAELYDLEVRAVNQAIKRNKLLFPEDFCFKLTKADDISDQSQVVIGGEVTSRNKVYPKAE